LFLFNRNIIFFSHNKSAETVFRFVFSAKRGLSSTLSLSLLAGAEPAHLLLRSMTMATDEPPGDERLSTFFGK